MRALEWQQFLQSAGAAGKVVFSVAELANVAGRDAHALNVELSRLMKAGVIQRYTQGQYGMPGLTTPVPLVGQVDTSAYITGHWALHRANHVDQRPYTITCFSARRHNRSRIRNTPLGRLEFISVRPPIYAPPGTDDRVAGPEQALCDYVYLCLQNALRPESLVHFRSLDRLSPSLLAQHAARYPRTVQAYLRRLCRAARS